jgi:hypothetical protein
MHPIHRSDLLTFLLISEVVALVAAVVANVAYSKFGRDIFAGFAVAIGMLFFAIRFWPWKWKPTMRVVSPPGFDAKLTFDGPASNNVGLLAKGVRVTPYGDLADHALIEIDRLIGPRAVLTAFYQIYGNVATARERCLTLERLDDHSQTVHDMPVLASIGASAQADDMLVGSNVQIVTIERPTAEVVDHDDF